MSRELDILIEQERVGRLFENSGIWSFEYDDHWAASGYPLAPGLPLQNERILASGLAVDRPAGQ
ncbi:MAG: HipA N-terminal domain-containing protein [Rhodocyclaceae bacterium]